MKKYQPDIFFDIMLLRLTYVLNICFPRDCTLNQGFLSLNWEEALAFQFWEILGRIIAQIAQLGNKKAGESLEIWQNCMILKKFAPANSPFRKVCTNGFQVEASKAPS